MFSHIKAYAGDPILSLMEQYKLDARPNKINLSIGLYYNEQAIVPLLPIVAATQQQLKLQTAEANTYLPMDGLATFNQAVQNLLFGPIQQAELSARLVSIQTIGGSGALKIGADFLKQNFPDSAVWLSQPSWENHLAIFSGAGFKVNFYPYFDQQNLGVDFVAMLNCFKQLPAQTIVLMHPCCHNPTGADLTATQWDEIIILAKQRQLILFFDLAYQGLAAGLTADVYALHQAALAGVPTLIANSFSKIFSLYSSRVGALTVICDRATSSQNVLGQLKATVRQNYSSPPIEGAQVVAAILTNPSALLQWQQEVAAMRLRIQQMRQALVTALKQAAPELDFSYILKQRGMFSYTNLTAVEVKRLREEFAIYILTSGRICLAGLNTSNVKIVAQAIAQVKHS